MDLQEQRKQILEQLRSIYGLRSYEEYAYDGTWESLDKVSRDGEFCDRYLAVMQNPNMPNSHNGQLVPDLEAAQDAMIAAVTDFTTPYTTPRIVIDLDTGAEYRPKVKVSCALELV